MGVPLRVSEDETHREFRLRLQEACDNNPNVPPPNEGRLRWFEERMQERGQSVKQETARKWLAGIAMPRPKSLPALAAVLNVSEYWLLTGVGRPDEHLNDEDNVGVSQLPWRDPVSRPIVRLVSGFIEMEGGITALARSEDALAVAERTDLHAIMRGRLLNFIVADVTSEGDDIIVRVYDGGRSNIILAAVRGEGMNMSLYRLWWEDLMKEGVLSNGVFTVPLQRSRHDRLDSFQSLC